MKRLILLCSLFGILLVGCGSPEIEGIILEVNDNGSILLAENLSMEAYEEIKEESPTTLQNETVAGECDLDLIDLSYEDTDDLQKGDQVEVWLDGDIMTSFPAQATAKKVQVKK
ncbi:MAG TPA: DUF3221 domain-containing protein [Pseudogracilibacillus sp.]|nr:DUF3221 domain-containing protein [Pseudogracilibacillus sp.]